jgi:hypothetical protein
VQGRPMRVLHARAGRHRRGGGCQTRLRVCVCAP